LDWEPADLTIDEVPREMAVDVFPVVQEDATVVDDMVESSSKVVSIPNEWLR
jgi:hypothetical protein